MWRQWLSSRLTGELIIFQLKIPYLRSILIFLSRSFMDMWILFYSFPAIAVTRVEDRDKPILGTIFRWRRCETRFWTEIFPGSCRQSSSTGRAQPLGARLLLRSEGGAVNQGGQGGESGWWWSWWKTRVGPWGCWVWSGKIIVIAEPIEVVHQDSYLPRGHHHRRHCPHPLPVNFHPFSTENRHFHLKASLSIRFHRHPLFFPTQFVVPQGWGLHTRETCSAGNSKINWSL